MAPYWWPQWWNPIKADHMLDEGVATNVNIFVLYYHCFCSFCVCKWKKMTYLCFCKWLYPCLSVTFYPFMSKSQSNILRQMTLPQTGLSWTVEERWQSLSLFKSQDLVCVKIEWHVRATLLIEEIRPGLLITTVSGLAFREKYSHVQHCVSGMLVLI